MKKAITAIFIIAIMITTMCLTACEDSGDTIKDSASVFIVTDDETGVQYIYRVNSGITPRYNPDGTLHTVNDKEGDKLWTDSSQN